MRENALPATQHRKCKGCPTQITPKRPHQLFCSDPCRMAWHKKKVLGPQGQLDELQRQVEALKAGTEELKRRVTALEVKPAA